MTKFCSRKSGKNNCSLCELNRSKQYRLRLKSKAVEYKGGCCEICGYNKCLRSLVFHHRDPSEKDFAIGESRPGYKIVRKWDLVKVELDKCQLLCHNCHNEIHHQIETEKSNKYKDYNIHKKNIHLINTHIIKGRFTPDQMMEKINKGQYETKKQLNSRELAHEKWVEKSLNQTVHNIL